MPVQVHKTHKTHLRRLEKKAKTKAKLVRMKMQIPSEYSSVSILISILEAAILGER